MEYKLMQRVFWSGTACETHVHRGVYVSGYFWGLYAFIRGFTTHSRFFPQDFILWCIHILCIATHTIFSLPIRWHTFLVHDLMDTVSVCVCLVLCSGWGRSVVSWPSQITIFKSASGVQWFSGHHEGIQVTKVGQDIKVGFMLAIV